MDAFACLQIGLYVLGDLSNADLKANSSQQVNQASSCRIEMGGYATLG